MNKWLTRLRQEPRRQYQLLVGRYHALRQIFSIMGARWWHIVIPVCLSLLTAGLDGVGLGLLVPLAQGVTRGDFSSVEELPVIGSQLAALTQQLVGADASLNIMFFVLAGTVIAVNLLATVITYGAGIYQRHLEELFRYELHTRVYRRYLDFGKLYFDRKSQGEVRTVLDYTERIIKLFRSTSNTLEQLFRLVIHILILASISHLLLLILLPAVVVITLVNRGLGGTVDRYWQRAKEATMAAGREAFNTLSMLPLVWSYSQQEQAQQEYEDLNRRQQQARFRAFAWGDFLQITPRLMTFIVLLGAVAIISFVLARDDPAVLATHIVFLYIASRTLPMMKALQGFRVLASELWPHIIEVLVLFIARDKYRVPQGTKQWSGLQNTIQCRNLSFAYNSDKPILKKVSLTVQRGQHVAIVGPTGAGKSTLLHLLLRFYDCPAGTILLDHQDIRQFTHASLRQHMALLTQEPQLLNDTLHKNITYGIADPKKEDVQRAISDSRLDELVTSLPAGLETVIGDRGAQLSGGEKQRVALARAMLKNADLVLLDEATSALDSRTEQQIQAVLTKALAGKTAIIVAHRLATIRNADLIIYLKNGEIVETGTWAQLMKKRGHLYGQWQSQEAPSGTENHSSADAANSP